MWYQINAETRVLADILLSILGRIWGVSVKITQNSLNTRWAQQQTLWKSVKNEYCLNNDPEPIWAGGEISAGLVDLDQTLLLQTVAFWSKAIFIRINVFQLNFATWLQENAYLSAVSYFVLTQAVSDLKQSPNSTSGTRIWDVIWMFWWWTVALLHANTESPKTRPWNRTSLCLIELITDGQFFFLLLFCYLEEFLCLGHFVLQLSGRAAEGTAGQNWNFLETQRNEMLDLKRS